MTLSVVHAQKEKLVVLIMIAEPAFVMTENVTIALTTKIVSPVIAMKMVGVKKDPVHVENAVIARSVRKQVGGYSKIINVLMRKKRKIVAKTTKCGILKGIDVEV